MHLACEATGQRLSHLFEVMAGLVPAIYVFVGRRQLQRQLLVIDQ